MIERLVTSLHALSALPRAALESAEGRTLIGDCADALRLELDCPQQSLTPDQRAALKSLSNLLEEEAPRGEAVGAAAQWACDALGLGQEGESRR